jgi:subtilisin-like proprotein convertase family protein
MQGLSRLLVYVGLLLAVTVALAASDGEVALRSGVVRPAGNESPSGESGTDGPERFVVKFANSPGWHEKGAVEMAGGHVVAPLPGQAYLVTVPQGRAVSLSTIPGVMWATPYLPQHKISPEIAEVVSKSDEEADVIVLLHLFPDADANAVAAELSASGLRVEGASNGSRFDRIVMRMAPAEVASHRAGLAERNDIFWIEKRHRRYLTNDNSIWVGQSGLYGGNATPVFDHGIYGTGQTAAVLDTGLDADACYFRDDVNGLPPTNTSGGTTVDNNQRKVIAVDFLDSGENPSDPTNWDTQGHGTHVAGTLAGDNMYTPIEHDLGDGMAPAAKLIIQDAGYAADACGDLPGIGCPVTDLVPIFQQAYDQGARVHSNSWNDNENAAVQNNYTDASEDVDEFMWNHPDFLIVFACGNDVYGGFGTMGSPSTAKNTLSTGGTFGGENGEYLSDISAWGPTDDGRLKPDVVFPGASITSAGNDSNITTNNCSTSGMTGTSMTAPGVSGMALLTREYFMDGWYPTGSPTPANGFTPTAALLKAMLINSGTKIGWDAEGRPLQIPGIEQGWGRVLLDDALYFAGDSRGLWVDEYDSGFTAPSDPPVIYQLEMEDTGEPLEITLAWTDYPSTPAATTHLINDLDLRVDGPSGGFVGNNFLYSVSLPGGEHDRLNNVEGVIIEDPAPGIYSIRISPHAIPSGPQPFALVVTGGRFSVTAGPQPAHWSHIVDDSGPNANGDGVLDPGETANIEVTLWNAGDAAATSVLGHLYSAHDGTLIVYEGTTSYADMPVGAQAGSASPHYQVTLQPSAECGQVLGANMGIEGDGFEVGSFFTLDIGEYEQSYPSSDTPVSIPRDGEANSYINVPSSFVLTEVDATINIDYDDIGNIEVLLYPPGATNPPVWLHNGTSAGVSGLHTTYDDLTEPDGPGSLASFLALDPQGTWRLKVINNDRRTGDLLDWTLHLKGETPFDCNPVSCGEGIPSAVGNTLMLGKSGADDVQLSWTGVGASNYNVWRAADKQLRTNSHVGVSASTSLTDSGAQNLPGLHVYVVRSVNSCDWESD